MNKNIMTIADKLDLYENDVWRFLVAIGITADDLKIDWDEKSIDLLSKRVWELSMDEFNDE